MSWATATCKCEKCGCTFHPRKECFNSTLAADWESWAADHITVCGECEHKSLEEKRNMEAMKAKEAAQAAGLPDLQGSEKQVRWALTIREKMAVELNRMRRRYEITAERQPDQKEICEASIAAIDRILSAERAGFWIDNKCLPVDMIIKRAREGRLRF